MRYEELANPPSHPLGFVGDLLDDLRRLRNRHRDVFSSVSEPRVTMNYASRWKEAVATDIEVYVAFELRGGTWKHFGVTLSGGAMRMEADDPINRSDFAYKRRADIVYQIETQMGAIQKGT